MACGCSQGTSSAAALQLNQRRRVVHTVFAHPGEGEEVVTWKVQPNGMQEYMGPVTNSKYLVHQAGGQVIVKSADVPEMQARGWI